MNRIKGILYAAVSSSTFGLAPFFSVTLLMIGFSAFEVLSYRWGVASIVLTVLGLFSGCNFRLSVKDFKVVFGLSLLRAITSFSLIIAGYIIGVRTTRAVRINSTVLTCYVMGLGTLFYLIGAFTTSGFRLVTDGYIWLIILGLALPATAISNITLVQAIKYAGPTLTSILGAMEPLTAVVIGVFVFEEFFTVNSAIGIILILIAVSLVIFRKPKN